MKKIFAERALVIMISIFVMGLIFLFSSVKAGEKAGHKAMVNNGGSMNTSAYYRVIDTTTLNYQIIGGVSSLIGGCGLLISGYAIYKEM